MFKHRKSIRDIIGKHTIECFTGFHDYQTVIFKNPRKELAKAVSILITEFIEGSGFTRRQAVKH